MNARGILLISAGSFSFLAVCFSTWLINQHHSNMTHYSVQSKIIGIIWMIPIYSIDSFLSLLFPSVSLNIDMLRDCYEAYVLYLFLSLMLSYLNSYDGEGIEDHVADRTNYDDLIDYLENKDPAPHLPLPFSLFYNKELPKGRDFLRFCKFGTMQRYFVVLMKIVYFIFIQYCLIRPLTTLTAILLDRLGLYHEGAFDLHSSWLYLTIMVNISIGFAFAALATFYSTLKKKLAPYGPVGKFLCIKFVIFFAFWQSVVIAILVRTKVIHDIDGYTARTLSRGLQDTLICGEMFAVSVAHLFTFSYKPFTEENRRAKRTAALMDSSESALEGPLIPQSEAYIYESGSGKRLQKKQKKCTNRDKVQDLDGGSGRNYTIWSLYAPPSHRPRDDANTVPTVITKSENQVSQSLLRSTGPAVVNHACRRSQPQDGVSQSGTRQQSVNIIMSIFDRNFASKAAVRDFNESMPVIVLPSSFVPEKGTVEVSRPSDRVSE